MYYNSSNTNRLTRDVTNIFFNSRKVSSNFDPPKKTKKNELSKWKSIA